MFYVRGTRVGARKVLITGSGNDVRRVELCKENDGPVS